MIRYLLLRHFELNPSIKENMFIYYYTTKWTFCQVFWHRIIESLYAGDNDQLFFPVYALRDVTIRINDRICQFRIVENQPPIEFNEVKFLNSPDRGGIGSTGIK